MAAAKTLSRASDSAAAVKNDKDLAKAIELAKEAAIGITQPELVGEHIGFEMEEERVGTHLFASTARGYRGWNWAVTITRSPRSKSVTVSETCLRPGEGAILAPTWVPWSERLQPGDVGPGDVTPKIDDDPLLMAGFEACGDEELDDLAVNELGLGRVRVLSGEGREAAATRWYQGSHGPSAEVAVKAPAPCSSCGYFVPLSGLLRRTFGVCANEWSPGDGSVVSLDHGCGAHSEVDMPEPASERVPEPIVDEFAVELI